MENTEKVQVLEEQVQQLQVDKIELIRSTSTEIERLRRIIRTLTNPNANTNIKEFKLEYQPLTNQEKDKISSTNYTIPHKANGTINTDIEIKKWSADQENAPNTNRVLGSLREEKIYEYNTTNDRQKENKENTTKTDTKTVLTDEEKRTHRSEESIFRLNTKRMSYKGFEFGDFGFMTTDFDQLSRGHTQWVNQVMHHPVQNGIVITASDDWCVMFWRFKKPHQNDELKRYKMREELKLNKTSDITPNKTNSYYVDPKLQHIVGEIELLPVLKINTGLEVKGIAMSSNGSILACTCYDEEEDEGNPELQLYFDLEQRWTFKAHQFNPYYGNVGRRDIFDDSPYRVNDNNNDSNNGGRLISRRIISLPFEPIPHCIVFSRDNKYVFVAMYSSSQILAELNEELQEEYGVDNVPAKWPDHPVSLCCVNVTTLRIVECEKIWQYLGDDEHVQCMAISPSGAHIAAGTSLGQLIVTGVLNLTGDAEDEEDFNPLLHVIWSSNMIITNDNNNDNDGSITAIDWSPDSNWIICGHASGVIKFWRRNEKKQQRRLSTQLNKTINEWMNKSNVRRKTKMFDCKWYLEGLHIEAINSISIRGTMMVSGADDGNVVIYDLLQTFIANNTDSSPITIGRIDKIHGGRMVNSVALANNYSELNLLIPTNAHFMVTSGADNIVHCVNIMDVCRETIRQNYSNQKLN